MLVIIGATGKTGSETVIAKGHKVRVVERDAAKLNTRLRRTTYMSST
jgi:putative NADH-flavin reductase